MIISVWRTTPACDTVQKYLKTLPQVEPRVKLNKQNYSEAVDDCDSMKSQDIVTKDLSPGYDDKLQPAARLLTWGDSPCQLWAKNKPPNTTKK